MEGFVSLNFQAIGEHFCAVTGPKPFTASLTGGSKVNYALIGLAVSILLWGGSALADTSTLPMGNSKACMEGPLEQFGRYIGNWDIEDSQLGQDGQTWTDGPGAEWNFVCLGNGTAIQDFWMPADGSVGTNLRTWNPETASWDIAWAINNLPGFAHITAKQDENGSVVMHYVSPVPDPLRRITFFPPDENGWNWKLEFSSDDGESWLEVYRIKATRSRQ